ncbi:MAG: hypothetical protein C4293_05715 [Nitrospiraceae bacterium]
MHEKYGLRQLDSQVLIEAFLGERDEDKEALRNGKIQQETLALERVEEQPEQIRVISAEASPWYCRGIESYPITPEENKE